METIEKKETKEFQLPRKVVILKPLLDKTPGMVKDPNHAASFLIAGCNRKITTPRIEGQSETDCPLTPEEIKFFENKKISGMSFEEGDLNIHSKKWGKKGGYNWWEVSKDAKITIADQEIRFDLSKPMDYIRYKILLKNKNLIARNRDELKYRPDCLYVFEEVSETIRSKATSANKKLEAYGLLSAMSKDKDRMIDVCLALGIKVTSTQEISFLTAAIDQFIEEKIDTFLEITTDQYFDEKVLIAKLIKARAVTRKGSNYYLASDSSPMCERGESPYLENVCFFLRQPENQELRITLESKLKQN